MTRRAFTLIEMMLAVVLAAMLMAALLLVLGAVARDRRIVASLNKPAGHDALLAQLRWDLANARAITASDDGLSITLTGHGAIDRESLAPTNRLVAVTYRVVGKTSPMLIREQECLDDAARPERWQECVAWDVKQLAVFSANSDPMSAGVAMPINPRMRVRLETNTETIDQELWIK